MVKRIRDEFSFVILCTCLSATENTDFNVLAILDSLFCAHLQDERSLFTAVKMVWFTMDLVVYWVFRATSFFK